MARLNVQRTETILQRHRECRTVAPKSHVNEIVLSFKGDDVDHVVPAVEAWACPVLRRSDGLHRLIYTRTRAHHVVADGAQHSAQYACVLHAVAAAAVATCYHLVEQMGGV